MLFKNEFCSSLVKYSSDELVNSFWNEIERAYKAKNRFYHNFDHLENLFEVLKPFKTEFQNWDVIVFAIAYHDVVYNVLKSDNEEKSAALATERLSKTSLESDQIENCKQLILATKKHELSKRGINLFTDADLSVLGASSEIYRVYAKNIRKEYSVFPDLIYNPGRRKVLKHFLEMPRIFKTDEFNKLYEKQARVNLELELLSLK